RIDRILDAAAPDQALGGAARALLLSAVMAAALGFAGAHAEPRLAAIAAAPAVLTQNRAAPSSNAASASVPRPTRRPAMRHPIVTEMTGAEDYNPRALLDAPTVIVAPAALFVAPQ